MLSVLICVNKDIILFVVYQNLYQIVDQLGITDDMQRKLAEQKAKIDKEKIRLQTEMDSKSWNLRHGVCIY